jgi:hypothetical protein
MAVPTKIAIFYLPSKNGRILHLKRAENSCVRYKSRAGESAKNILELKRRNCS